MSLLDIEADTVQSLAVRRFPLERAERALANVAGHTVEARALREQRIYIPHLPRKARK